MEHAAGADGARARPSLRALIVGDSPDDAETLRGELARAYDVVSSRVRTAAELEAALAAQTFDVVLSDWRTESFDATAALGIVKDHGLDVPFIVVASVGGDDVAIDALRRGANDFFRISRLTLLTAAVRRELREAALRRERRQMQEQLLVSDRMASVGVLAAGVAHEINNPLGAVLGNLVLAQRTLAALPVEERAMGQLREIIEELRDAHEAAQRIRDVAGDLKLFARANAADEATAVDVRQAVESSLRMARTEIRHRARLSTAFKPVPPVLANASRLSQVFLNLVVNAAQAIPEGRADANEIAIATFVDDDGWVVVEVRDSGVGMTPDVQQKLFSPFFTTKPVGVGTGLGLSICHRIVRSFGGAISVESEVGEGSVFQVRLHPAGELGTAPAARLADPPAARRRGSVLVIDDEPAIGVLVERVLSPDHDVRRTGDAGRAIEWIAAGARFDVILCDLMMPQVTGMEFFERLRARVPEQAAAVVFITGGTFTAPAREFVAGLEMPLLEKPFDVDALRALVNERV